MGCPSWIWKLAPFAAMVAVECTDVGVSSISKVALAHGMSKYVSVVYYNALATFFLAPFFFFNRKKRAPITFSLLLTFFLLALIGSSGQIIFLAAVKLSSPTLSSALANLIPIFTFLLALLTRMETVDLRRSSSQAKCLGAIVSVAGAFIVTLYKGPALFLNSAKESHQKSEWILGGLLMVIVCLLSATWNIAQGATVKQYPEKITIVFFFTLFITIQSAVFSFIFETNPNAWILNSRIEIVAILFTGVFGSVFRIGIHTWCLEERGAVFVAMFKPLGIAIAQFITFIFLGDIVFVGSVMGSVIIAIGFYSVIWGQMQEKKQMPNSSILKAPLLHPTNSNL
ncbi:WAT1-related protein At5g40240-like [Euphorbia lathyris]|uniref:WAT1-related protein At5g40240-like n=1 Tax=Euphorbia lathyris TaxID=212925 RepID=UPI0033142637